MYANIASYAQSLSEIFSAKAGGIFELQANKSIPRFAKEKVMTKDKLDYLSNNQLFAYCRICYSCNSIFSTSKAIAKPLN